MANYIKKNHLILLLMLMIIGVIVAIILHNNKGVRESYIIKDDITFSDGWNYDFCNGISGVTSLPNTLEKNNSDVLILTKTLPDIDKSCDFLFRARHTEVKIYVGDELRADTTKDRRMVGINYQEVEINPSDSGKEIRIESYSDISRYLISPGKVYLGDRGSFFLSIIRSKWKTLSFMSLLSFLAIVLLMLWIMNTLVLKHFLPELLCLSLFSLGVAAWLFTESDCAQFLVHDTGRVSILAYEVLMLLPIPIALFFLYYSDRKKGRVASYVASIIPIVLFVINNILDILGVVKLAESLIVTQIVLVFEIIYVAIVQILEIIYKFREKEKYNSVVWKIPLIGIAILVPLALIEVVKYIFFATKYPNDGVLISIGVFFYMLSLAVDSVVRMNFRAEKFKESSEVKTQFLANMSHEIRTPLNAILGFNEVILRTTNEDRTRDYSVDIQQAGESLMTIINSILDISKIEAGKLEIYSVEYDTVEFFNHVITVFESMAKKKGLSFKADIDSRIPKVLIGDENHILRVIVNILSNAVKYTQTGGVTFTVKLEEASEDVPICKLLYSVKDTGIGIKEEDRGRLFEKFERLDKDKNYSTEGTGLGMSIVVQLLKAMGSEIQLESEYGVGSEFYFVLTQSVVNREQIGSFEQRREEIALSENENAGYIAPDANILIVDDVQMNLDMTCAVLKELKAKVSTAMSGMEAIEKIKNEHFDIVLMDHMMPGMDGIEAAENIRNLAMETMDVYYAELPIIALTANAMVGMKEKFFIAGMQDFISKPVKVSNLFDAIKKWLPKDKIQKLSQEEMKAMKKHDNEEDEKWRKLPQIIHKVEAKQFCNTYELFERNIKNYRSGYEATSNKLRQFMEENDGQNYKITVHGLKSTSKMIGLLELSEMAMKQENLCQDGKEQEVWPHTEELLEEYKKCVEEINVFLDGDKKNDDNEAKQCSDEDYNRLLHRIKAAAINFDMGEFMELESELDEVVVSEDKKDEFEKIKEMVINASFGDIQELLADR